MAKRIKISIITRDKIAYEGEAEAIFVPTQTGLIEVLSEHMQLVSALAKGEIVLKNSGKDQTFKITGGVIEIRSHSEVIILVDLIKGE